MKYLSLDIETSGLNPETDTVFSVGAVADDLRNPVPLDQLPKIHIFVDVTKEQIQGNIHAFAMNAYLMKHIIDLAKKRKGSNDSSYVPGKDLYFADRFDVSNIIAGFVDHHGLRQKAFHPINAAGKNMALFDIPFLNNSFRLDDVVKIRYRVLDPAILYLRPEDDFVLPDLAKCKERAGFQDDVTHDALDDAMDVVRLIRHHFTCQIEEEVPEECLIS